MLPQLHKPLPKADFKAVAESLSPGALTTVVTVGGEEAVFFGALDISLLPDRGHVKYAAQHFNHDDLERLRTFAAKANPKTQTVLSDTRRFVDFLQENPLSL